MGDVNDTQVKLMLDELLEEMKSRYNVEGNDIRMQTEASFLTMLESLNEVNELNDRFYKLDETGKFPPVNNDALIELERKYSAAIEKCNDFITTLNNAGADGLEVKQVTEKVANVLNSDINKIMNIDPRKNLSLPNALADARTIVINLGEQKMSKAGNQLSSRGLIEIPSENGGTMKGFYTEDFQFNTVEIINQSIEELRNLPGEEKADYITIFEHLRDQEQYANKLFYAATDSDLTKENIMAMGFDEEKAEALHNSREFNKALDGLRINIINESNGKHSLYAMAGYGYHSYISKRNVGMSRMADMLGMPNILGRAVNITFKQTVTNPETGLEEEKTSTGVFMENVAGVDPFHVTENDPVRSYGADVYNTPQALENIADLQVLDYVCGNTDRHHGNMIFQFSGTKEHPVFDGVRGIDNDMSFPISNNPDGEPKITGVNAMKVMSEKTYNMLNAITPEMVKVMMKDLSFGISEINSVMARIENIKQAVRENKITIVKEGEWKNYNLTKLAEGKNYFSTVDSGREQMADLGTYGNFAKVDREDILNGKDYENDLKKLQEISSKLDTTWRDKDQYKKFISSLHYAQKLATELSQNPMDVERGQDYQIALENLQNASQEYTAYKEGKINGQRAQNRLDATKEMTSFIKERLPKFKEKLHATAEERMEREMMQAKAEAMNVKLDPADIETRLNAVKQELNTKGFNPKAFAQFKAMTMLQNDGTLENSTEQKLEDIAKKIEKSEAMNKVSKELAGKKTDLRNMNTMFNKFVKEEVNSKGNPEASKVEKVHETNKNIESPKVEEPKLATNLSL